MCVISFHVLSFPCASCASCHVQVFAILAIAAQSQVSTVLLNTVLISGSRSGPRSGGFLTAVADVRT